jgi:hypothetical protein
MFSVQTCLYAGISHRLENSYTCIAKTLVKKEYVVDGLIHIYFQAVD